MRRALLVILLAACGGKPAAPAPTPPTPALSDAERAVIEAGEALRVDMCACENAQCMMTLGGQRWESTFIEIPEGISFTDAGAAQFARAYLESLRCISVVVAGTTPPATADREIEAAVVAEAEAVRDGICGCADRACTNQFGDRWNAVFGVIPDELAVSMVTDDSAARYGHAYLDQVRCAAALPPGQSDAEAALAEVRVLRQRACECTDTECTNQVWTEFVAFQERHKDTKGSTAQVDELKSEFTQMQACTEALRANAPAP